MRRASRRIVWLAAAGLAVAAPPAHAGDGLEGVTATPDVAALASDVLEEVVAAEPTLAVAVEPSSVLPAAPPEAAAAEPARTGAAAAPPPEPVAQPQAPAAPPAEPHAEAPTAAAPAPTPDPPPASSPGVVQQAPANVNVSVRIDSPGDDGDVEQLNAAVQQEADAGAQYQPDPVRYQPVEQADEPVREPAAAPPPADSSSEWEWTWNWSCGDAPAPDVVVPGGATVRSWVWNWDWNCGEDVLPEPKTGSESLPRYQLPTTQYRPVNINVAIRINSPGDNGRVVQTNLAAAAVAPVLAALPRLPALPATPAFGSLPIAPAVAALPAEVTAAVADAGALDALAAVADDEVPLAIVAGPLAAQVELSLWSDGCCVRPAPRGWDAGPEAELGPVGAVPRRTRAGIAVSGVDTVAVVAQLELRARRGGKTASPPRPQVRPGERAPARRGDDIADSALVGQDALGFVSSSAPERRLPFAALALFAFAFTFVNVWWLAARSRPTPGVDPDDPPDRPG